MALARAVRMTVVGAEFIACSIRVVPLLSGASGRGEAAARGVGIRVVEHVAGSLAGADRQDERCAGAGIAYRDPGPTVDRRPPQADLEADAGAAV